MGRGEAMAPRAIHWHASQPIPATRCRRRPSRSKLSASGAFLVGRGNARKGESVCSCLELVALVARVVEALYHKHELPQMLWCPRMQRD